jgi:hypothetical protein
MAYGDLKVRNLIWNTGSGDNTVVLNTLATQSYVTTGFAPKANPTFTGTVNGADLVLSGNLTVNGTQTIINTQTLDVEDKQIEIGKVSSPSDTTADQGGWKLKGATDKTFLWVNATDAWTSSEHIHLGDNKKLLLGTGSDFQIYHNGSTSFLTDGIGDLRIRGDAVKIQSASGENSARFIANGAVELYYDNSKKFETTSLQIFDNNGSGTAAAFNTNGSVELYYDGSKILETLANGIAVAGKVDITNGHLYLDDNYAARFGTGEDLLIYHDGTNSYIKNTTNDLTIWDDSRIRVRTPSFMVNNQADSENILVGTENGSVDLYYDGVKKIETTSGGANVIGALTVNGSALSSAPQITATTDGALTAGDAVIVKSDGEVTKAQGAFNVLSPYTTPDATGFAMGSNDVENCIVIFDSALSTSLSKLIFWILYRNQNSSDQIWMSSYNATDNTYVNGADKFGSGVPWKGVYDTTNSRMLLTYRDSAGDINVSSVQTTGVNSSDVAVNDTEEMASVFSSNENYFYGLSYQGSGISVWAGPDSTTSAAAVVLTVASNGTITKSSNQNFNVSSTMHEHVRVAGNGTEVVVIYTKANDSYHAYYRVGTISGSGSSASISWGTETEYFATSPNDHDVAYDSVNDKYLFMYQGSSATGKVKVGTVSGTSISFGSETAFSGGSISNQGNIAYNVKTESFTICFEDSSNGNRIQTRDAKISGTSVTVNTNLDTSQYTTNKGFNVAHGYVSDSIFGSFLAYRYNSGKLRGQRLSTMEAGTNLTTENFIGFASASYSDNATATIDVSGATNSNQSSLTAGQKYFVQNNGSLGLTAASPAVFAGTAISATKLIVNDQQPVPDGGWHLLIKNNFTIDSSHNGNGNSHTITEVLNTTYAKYNFLKLVIFVYVDNGDIDEFGVQHLFDDSTNQYKDSHYCSQSFAASNGSDHSAARSTSSAFASFKRMSADQHHAEAVLSLPQQSGLAKVWNVSNMGWRNTLGSDDQHVAHIMSGHKTSTDPLKGIRFRFGSIGGSNSGKCFYRLLGME